MPEVPATAPAAAPAHEQEHEQEHEHELRRIELLAGLPPEVARLVVEAFERVDLAFGDVLMRAGDPADSYWVLTDGQARVVGAGGDGAEVTLATLGPGATFGEGALFGQGLRTSTVRASLPGTAYRLDASVLRALAATQPSVLDSLARARRRHEVGDLLRLASPLARVAGGALPELVDRLQAVTLTAGECLELDGAALYLVEEGRLMVRPGDGADLPRYARRGDTVGEALLLAERGRTEVAEAVSDARLLALGREDLERVLAAHPALRGGLAQLAALYESRQELVHTPLDFTDAAGQAEPSEDETGSAAAAAPRLGTRAGTLRRRVRRPPVIRQIDEMDCGVAALAMVCRSFGRQLPLSRLRTLVGTGIDGTSAAGIVRAARSVGLEAKAVKASKSELARLPTPFIAHWQGYHWVVVTDVRPSAVFFDDPALGHRRLDTREFEEGWTGYVVEAQPGPDFVAGGSRFEGMGWIGDLVRPHRARIWTVAALAVGLSVLSLSLEVVIQVVVDRVVGPHHAADLAAVFVVLGAVTVLLTAGTLGQRLLLLRTAAALDRDGLQALSARLLSLPLSYFSSRRTGDVQRRLDGLRMARRSVSDIAVVGLGLGAQLVASLGLLFYYSVPIGVAFCVCVPVYLLVTRAALVRLGPVTASLEEEAARYASRQVEVVKGIETAKALAAEGPLQQSLVELQSALNARQVGHDRLRAGYSAVSQGLGFAILAAFLVIADVQVAHHSLSVGGLVACVTLVALATAPMQQLVVVVDSVQHARTLVDRAQDVFDSQPEQGEDHRGLGPVPSISGHVTLEDVTFTYDAAPGGPPVLDGISVDIPAGATVAVVGRSGSGKTTFARCVAALVTPTSGRVRFDNVDATELDHRQLRRHIGLVLQETYLFSDTVAANIAFGSELDPVRVREAAQLANAAEFVERLPLGYETPVGESGMALSGGQRQRLAIARALYRRPALLVLDEATSALDAESERAIQDNLGRVVGDCTAIVIAHRLSTVRHADLIVVLDRGRLVEQGTHDELVARRGLYFLLTAQQLDL